jgi:hypothetical protein
MTGRPSEFTDEIADEICLRIAAGESVHRMVLDDHMPDERTIYRWLAKFESFRLKYARAREQQMEFYAQEILEISDDGRNDWMERFGQDGESLGYQINGEVVQRSRLRVDSRKWLMSKLAPKKYGDKLDVEHTGKDGAPLIPVLNVTFAGDKS